MIKESYAYLLSPIAEIVRKKYTSIESGKVTGRAKDFVEEELQILTHVYDTIEARFQKMQQAVWEADYLMRLKDGELAFLKAEIADQQEYIDRLEAESIVNVFKSNTAGKALKEHASYIVEKLKEAKHEPIR